MVVPITKHRKEAREVDGVRRSLNLGAIGASSTTDYNIEDKQPTWAKYLPFNLTLVVNDSSSDIVFLPNMNTDEAISIPSGVISSFTGNLRTFRITNDSTAITDGQLRLVFERTGMTPDKFTVAISKNVFAKALLGL